MKELIYQKLNTLTKLSTNESGVYSITDYNCIHDIVCVFEELKCLVLLRLSVLSCRVSLAFRTSKCVVTIVITQL